jgi:hypothetical protein
VDQHNRQPRGKSGIGPALALGLVIVLLALAQTWPLAADFLRGIPYGYHPSPGWGQVPLLPGDHLQFYYWSWLFSDNLLGPSQLFTNPYEFSTFLHPSGIALYANFPFSLFYFALKPLGSLAAYNTVVLLSYLLAGLMAYALAKELLGDALAALPAALIFALLPFRASQALSGHLYGFIAFMLPLTLWCLERGWKRRPWLWGGGAGLTLLAMGMMEGHLLFYSTLLLGLYVPLRLLMRGREDVPQNGDESPWPALLTTAAAGLALGLTLHLAGARAGLGSLGDSGLPLTLCLALVLLLAAWLLLSWLATALTSLTPDVCRRTLARGLLPLVFSPVYALQFWLDVPHLGTVLVLGLLLWGAARCLPALWRARRGPALPPGTWVPLIPLGIGWALGVAAMLIAKSRTLDASIASAGRTLGEVKLYAPHLADLFRLEGTNSEQIVYLGLVLIVLALAGLLLLALGRPAGAKGGMLASLWAGLGLLAGLLCLGPNLPQIPLYAFLYDHLPFFNFPRVPGRLIIIAVLMLALLAGWTLRELARPLRGRRGVVAALGLALIALIAWDLWPQTQTGICLIPPPGKLEAEVKAALPTGPQAPQRLLGLPIWPGDSHQSSAYEFLVTRTRARLVNGYSPQVPRAYVAEVFWPLYPLDFGVVTPKALRTLQRLEVGLVAFYTDQEVYTRKVCPFPPELAQRRLEASGMFKTLSLAENVYLMRPQYNQTPSPRAGAVTSPVTSLWEAAWLRRDTGRLVEDRQASGWGLLFAEQTRPDGPLGPRLPRFAGNVAQARAGSDPQGWLSMGPGRPYPPGRYLARFRLRRGAGGMPGRIELADSKSGQVLAVAKLTPRLLPADGAWHDVGLAVELKEITPLSLRTYFNGAADLDLDLVLVNFSGRETPQGFYPASRLWRQTGLLLSDEQSPGGLAVLAQAGYHPPLYLMHGPQQTYEPGRYVANFRLAAPGKAPPGAPLAELVVASDLGRRPLGHRLVRGADLGAAYREVPLEFTVSRRSELGFRVLYRQGGNIKVAGVSVKRLD